MQRMPEHMQQQQFRGAPPSKRRQVRFVNDERFARSEGGPGVSQDGWVEKNKAVMMGLTVMLVLILIVIIVMLSRKKQGGAVPSGVPAFIGGGGWGGSSVSHIGQY